MKYKNVVFFGVLCSVLLIASGCQNRKLWYLFLNNAVDIAPNHFEFEEDSKKLSIPIIASHSLDRVNHDTKYLILVIHGGGLNAENTFKTALKTIMALKVPQSRFLVLAPQLIEGVKIKEKGLLFWDQAWRGGGLSLAAGLNKDLPRVSSFDVVDRLMEHSLKMNPGIKRILIMGHSAGGQFVMRYAAINNRHEILEQQGVSVRYVVANPSSYLYLNATRYEFNSEGEIQKITPKKLSDCPDYNKYKYGLEDLYGYADSISPDMIQKSVLTRPIFFLLGVKDDERNWSLDKSCEGDVQGENRYQRGLLYKYHLDQVAGSSSANRHIWLEIPEVGHNSTEMLTHPKFIEKLLALGFQ